VRACIARRTPRGDWGRDLTRLGLAVAALLLVATPAAAQDNPFGACKKPVPIRASGSNPAEMIVGRENAWRHTLDGSADGPVVIECDDTTLQADHVVFETDTHDIHAEGHVLLTQPDLTIYADRADLNGTTKFGTFYNARGTARIGDAASAEDQFGSSDPDVLFSGEKIAKTGPRSYTIEHGRFTTCVQPTSRWEMTESSATLTLDKHALLRNVVLRVKTVPLFYLPALYYPINKEGRSTGFLMPSYGQSSVGGTIISNAFFWAINRSQDATFYYDRYSKNGRGLSGDYRYVRSVDSRGNARVELLDERFGADTAAATSTQRSYRLTGDVNQALGHGLRAVGNVNYFTQISTQQLYQNVDDYANRQRSFSGTVSGGRGRMQVSGTAERTDYFDGLDQGQRTGRLPSVTVRVGDKPIGGSRVYLGGSAEGVYLVSQTDTSNPLTDRSLLRFDGGPNLRVPLSNLSFLDVTTEASWRLTEWSESLDPASGTQQQVPLLRQLLQTRVNINGPIFSRIFQTPGSHYADRFKHIISPTLSIDRTSTFSEFSRVVKIDSVDTQIGGVTQINYGVSNRVLARLAGPPTAPGATPRPGVAREILTVNIQQSYYSNAAASIYDPEYQSGSGVASPELFSPIKLDAQFKPVDTGSATFRMDIDSKYRAIRSVSASGRIEAPRVQVTAEWYKQLVIPQRPNFSAELASQFLSANATLRTRNNHFGGTYGFNYDLKQREWVNQRITGYYNTQCCGVNFDYQTRSTPLLVGRGVPSNHQFAVSFSLAGIGSFANPLGSFGGR
jgi:LPS-assembly protein